jgi:pimeloyl-ACP methyl ester carboxylesterase
MPDHGLREEPLQFGQGGRLFGILTQSTMPNHHARKSPVFVFLNAGMLHRVGPYGLYVRLARALAQIGFSSLRVDLAGKGDSPARTALTNSQSVTADYTEIVDALLSRLGSSQFVLAGLCSGADDAIRCAGVNERVIGMFLLDPVCSQDDGFRARAVIMKYTNTARYISWLKRRFNLLTTLPREIHENREIFDPLILRDPPTQEHLHKSFKSICERQGRVLSVFSQYSLPYYNQVGQLGRTLDVADYKRFCTELFWPHADHTYVLEQHRCELVEECKIWAAGFS